MKAFTGLVIACLAAGACGAPNAHIVGGSDAPDGQYPYQVSLRYKSSDEESHFCGGAIINKNYIVTAAHCVINFDNPYVLSVAVGSNHLDEPNAVYRVTNFIIHAGFNPRLRIHDIALIRVAEDIEFDENIQPIALPAADRNYDNYPLVATGWGRLRAEGPIPNHLQEIIVKGYPQVKCNRDYRGLIKESHICTLTAAGEGMCNGDSGGPLVADGVLVGIVSYGTMPCGSGNADVFTRVFLYRSWIQSYTEI